MAIPSQGQGGLQLWCVSEGAASRCQILDTCLQVVAGDRRWFRWIKCFTLGIPPHLRDPVHVARATNLRSAASSTDGLRVPRRLKGSGSSFRGFFAGYALPSRPVTCDGRCPVEDTSPRSFATCACSPRLLGYPASGHAELAALAWRMDHEHRPTWQIVLVALALLTLTTISAFLGLLVSSLV